MDAFIELWTDIVQDSGDSGREGRNPEVFNEFLETSLNLKIWDGAKDETLKSVLGVINRMLNESSSTSKGLILLNNFIRGIPTSRFITVQDSLISAIHLTVKYLESGLTQQLLIYFLPLCHKYPDINQVVTTTIVSKILSYFCEKTRNSTLPTITEINLLKICLKKYHGPCGNFRANLEKAVIPYLDGDCRGEVAMSMLQIMPLLSGTGGGGTKGDKHGQDWNQMTTKILRAMYECVVLLYGDVCAFEDRNPYETEALPLSLPEIQEENVYKRVTLLKQRIVGLTTALSFYLRDPFPTFKPVPQRGIVNMISKMLVLNPVDMLKRAGNSTRKELVFLASVIPSIHQVAFKLLASLISSVGRTLLTEAVTIEQLFLQELKWMSERRNCFESLKTEVYKSMLVWLKLTSSSVTSTKTVTAWIGFLRKDVEVEKEVIELNLSSKLKRKGQLRVSAGNNFLNSSEVGSIISKNSTVSQAALDLLCILLPPADAPCHRALYIQMCKIVGEFIQTNKPPSPYDDPLCRISAINCLMTLAVNPHSKSLVSLGLLSSLIQHGRNDPVPSVANCCFQISSLLERLVHPICPSMNFPTVGFTPAPEDTIEDMDSLTNIPTPIASTAETSESFCQTESMDADTSVTLHESVFDTSQASSSGFGIEIKDAITKTIQESLSKLLKSPEYLQSHQRKYDNSSIELINEGSRPERLRPPPILATSSTSSTLTNGFGGKHKSTPSEEVRIPPPKKTKVVVDEDKDDTVYTEWLKDFINVGPDN